MSKPLFDPAEHRPLHGEPWSEDAARAVIEAIAEDAVRAYRDPVELWPNAALDLDGDEPDMPLRNAYLGAAGTAWALDVLAADGLGPALPALTELTDRLPEDFRAAPELVDLEPPIAPSLLFGESGILLAVEAIRGDGRCFDQLETCIRRTAAHPSNELCWGSPGTMHAALELWRATGEERWRRAWIESADILLGRWEEQLWVQDMYGRQWRFVGAGHGFATNAAVLLAGGELLGDRLETVAARAAEVFRAIAVEEDEVAQWLPTVPEEGKRRPLQWCHGSPGMVTSMRALPADPETDRLLIAGGELTWRAGPLGKGPGLCHGTAGNGYAFLALHARFGDEVWLERARTFAMDAAADVARRREETGRGRYTLFTGDLGVAHFLRSCLSGDAGFPFLERALERPQRIGQEGVL